MSPKLAKEPMAPPRQKMTQNRPIARPLVRSVVYVTMIVQKKAAPIPSKAPDAMTKDPFLVLLKLRSELAYIA